MSTLNWRGATPARSSRKTAMNEAQSRLLGRPGHLPNYNSVNFLSPNQEHDWTL